MSYSNYAELQLCDNLKAVTCSYSYANGLALLCVTVPLFVTVCVPDESVVTTAPNIKYRVLAPDVSGTLGAVTVKLLLSYTAAPVVILRFVILPDQ
jgi:hypothetical protein